MISFKELKKNAKKTYSDFKEIKIAVMGDVATQFLSTAIKGFSPIRKLNLNVLDIDYNMIDAQVFDTGSELYEFEPNYVLIYMSSEKLYDKFCSLKTEEKYNFAQMYYDKIINYWNNINSNMKCNIIQLNFAEIEDNVFGNYSNKTQASFIYQLRKLNLMLMDGCQQIKNAYIVDLSYIQNLYGRKAVFDEKFYYSAKMTLSMDILPYVADRITSLISTLDGKFKKCVVLDLDNTLWGGVIGDDGINNIEIGELGTGRAFSDLQRWLKQLKERGILLAVCSKNNEDTAKEPFEKHPDMILKLDDISCFVANWDDKASNIKYIQQVMNLGMDSFVFLDDNPFERNMVRSIIPEITVPELPEDPSLYLSYLKELNLFETGSFSEEDSKRTSQYQAEIGRKTLEKSFASIDDYLIGLEMKAEVKPFDAFHYPRIAQLTQRSNQFNLRTIRYTEAEIEQIANDDKYITLYFTLEDKFGEHGLISVVIMEKQDKDTLFVNTWLMSCRVLKRGMEEFIVNSMVKAAKDNGFKYVIGEYLKTPKNSMVEHIYEKLGFEQQDNNCYKADVNTFAPNKTYIKEK